MKKLVFLPLLLAACSNEDLSVVGAARPLEACAVEALQEDLLEEATVDTAEGGTFELPIIVENVSGREVTPESFDFRWRCLQGQQPLVLPDIDALNFCLADNDPSFVGFDNRAVSAAGVIAPEGRGVVRVQIVPAALGAAFDHLLAIAREADGCCREGGSCSRDDTSNAHCVAFAEQTSHTPELAPSAVLGFAVYDGTYADQVGDAGAADAPRYRMSFGLVFRGTAAGGAESFSDEFTIPVSFCRSCGPKIDGVRQPISGMSCFH